MRLVTRVDLGGYAVAKPRLDVEITKPFVLLCGPNGSGKTATLRMMRLAMGLLGERAGRLEDGYGARPVKVLKGDDDLGRLAALADAYGSPEAMPRDRPGVLDVRALGWRGQRTWLFDSRVETLRLNPSAFEEGNFLEHASAMMAGKDRSHGEALRRAWMQSMWFAAGIQDHRDPYDAAEPPPHIAAIRDALFEPGPRPAERWLMVDEPETAVDANTLVLGLSLMLEEAREGHLRVFCASHSPVFAAGLADHPKVQVVEVGPNPWLGAQRTIFDGLRDPAKLAAKGVQVGKALRDEKARMSAEATARMAKERRAFVRDLPKAAKELLLAALAADGPVAAFRGKPVDRGTVSMANGVAQRPNLVRMVDKAIVLTDEGRAVADTLRAAETNRKTRAARKHASKAVPPEGDETHRDSLAP